MAVVVDWQCLDKQKSKCQSAKASVSQQSSTRGDYRLILLNSAHVQHMLDKNLDAALYERFSLSCAPALLYVEQLVYR